MELKRMYAPQKDSPTTFLLGAINSTDTFVIVGNAQLLPSDVPFPLTLGPDKTVTETVMVTEVNLGNNRIIFERGPGALPWPSGTTVARTFNADDLESVQENIVGINSEVETSKSDISDLTSTVGGLNTVVGNAGSGLVKGLADEITRATGAEAAETLRATTAENALNSSKINRSELPQILIDASYSADATKLTTTLSRYNASNQQSGSYSRILPLASSSTVGIMTPEAYNEITSLRNDVSALQQQGGKFIGLSFATKSALNSYIVPSSVKAGDFTYVIDDETKDDSTTRYVFNGATFDFAFVVNYDPLGIANTETPGIVKSSASISTGKVFVEMDGTMSLVGWDNLLIDVGGKVPTTRTVNSKPLSANITLSASDVSAVPTTRTVNSKPLSANITLSASDVSAVPTTRKINSKPLNADITLNASDVGATTTSINIDLLSTAWVGAGPYTQTVAVSGMTATKNASVGLNILTTLAQREAARNAMLNVTAQSTDQIVITADGIKPVITLPISVVLMP